MHFWCGIPRGSEIERGGRFREGLRSVKNWIVAAVRKQRFAVDDEFWGPFLNRFWCGNAMAKGLVSHPWARTRREVQRGSEIGSGIYSAVISVRKQRLALDEETIAAVRCFAGFLSKRLTSTVVSSSRPECK